MSFLISDILAGIGVLCLLCSGGLILAVWLEMRREDRAARQRAARRANWATHRDGRTL